MAIESPLEREPGKAVRFSRFDHARKQELRALIPIPSGVDIALAIAGQAGKRRGFVSPTNCCLCRRAVVAIVWAIWKV
jgi:hypothetical protein